MASGSRRAPGKPSSPYLVAAGAARAEALAVVASAPGGPALPEVDEVDEGLGAAAADEARRVPLPRVAGPVGVHHRAVPRHRLLAGLAALQQRGRGGEQSSDVQRTGRASAPRTCRCTASFRGAALSRKRGQPNGTPRSASAPATLPAPSLRDLLRSRPTAHGAQEGGGREMLTAPGCRAVWLRLVLPELVFCEGKLENATARSYSCTSMAGTPNTSLERG